MAVVASFSKFAFLGKTIRLHDKDIIKTISYSNLSKMETVFKIYSLQLKRSPFLIVFVWIKEETQRKVCGLHENDMKTYSW